jgi:TamB, inner membrane protein subunit of TAM complex
MNWQVTKNRIYWWSKKIFLTTLYFLLLFFVLSYALLQVPAVQTALTRRILQRFTQVSGFPIRYDRFYVVWYDRLEIDGLTIRDPAGNLMIGAKHIRLNFQLHSLLKGNDITLDGATIHSAQVNLVTIPLPDSTRELNINAFVDAVNHQFSPGSGSGKNPKITIEKITLDKSSFSYNDTEEDSISEGFDYFHFHAGIPQSEISDFEVIGDTLQMQVKSLSAMDRKTNLTIKELQTYFRYCRTSMQFLHVYLKTEKSILSDSIVFTYKDPGDFTHFNQRVNIHARLSHVILSSGELALFAPNVKVLGQPLYLSGMVDGNVSDFKYRDINIHIGRTALSGQWSAKGLPDLNNTFLDLNLTNGSAVIADLRYLFPDDIYEMIGPLGSLRGHADFKGFLNDFQVKGDFKTTLGNVRTDLTLKLIEGNLSESFYNGRLELDTFDLGHYLADTTNFQKISLNAEIRGEGLTRASANFILNGAINSIGFRNYPYANITTDAQFKRQLFNGKIRIDDPKLKLHGEGFVDFRKGEERISLKARLDTAFLKDLNLSEQFIFLASSFDIDTKGIVLDSLKGRAMLKDLVFMYEDETIRLDTIRFLARPTPGAKKLSLNCPFFDFDLEGDYLYSSLFSDFPALFKEFYLSAQNNPAAIKDYYLHRKHLRQPYDAGFHIDLRNVNPLLELLDVDADLSRDTRIDGKFFFHQSAGMQAKVLVDTLRIAQRAFIKNELDFNGFKSPDSNYVHASVSLHSSDQIISSVFKTKNLVAQVAWNGPRAGFEFEIDQDGLDNRVRLKAQADFLYDSTRVKILPSSIKILDREWTEDPDNYAAYRHGHWYVEHMGFKNQAQTVVLHGDLSNDPALAIQLAVTNFNLDILNSVSPDKISGIMNGLIILRSAFHNPSVQNDLTIDSLTINDFLIGNISGRNLWNQDDKKFDIHFSIDRKNKRIINLKGYYDPEDPVSPLFVNVGLENANLKIAEPFLRGIFSQLDGTLSGVYLIRGSFSSPSFSGQGTISNGQMMIDYLKTIYAFTGTVGMAPNQIQFKDFHITDALNNKGTLNGHLTHQSFTHLSVNLEADFTNFQVLNTTAKDNTLFYGQGFATGKVQVSGPLANLKISATARSQKNTKIFIPMKGTETVEKKDFINFYHFTDSTAGTDGKKKIKNKVLSGITMDLNLDITPDALVEIIFDIKAGDIIQGHGNGNIKLQLDTKGEFNMFGAVEFTKGAYNFTLYDIINKQFSINKGSRISWSGDPYQGTLNITASYRQMTSLAPIINDQTLVNDPAIKKKYPVEVILKLDGPMLSPQINFDIEAKDLPDNVSVSSGGSSSVNLRFQFDSFKAKLDEQELKKQVFSLIMLRQFSPYGESMNTSGTLASSVSELFSNQLSYWLSQVDQNLEIDFDLKGLDQEAFNTFQLRLSYSFLNGRLRVTRDGSFNSQYNRSDISTIAGDWMVDYLLTPDGKLKAKMYSRSNAASLTSSLGTQAALTTGASLIHTQNFNHFKDVFRSSKEKKKKKTKDASNNKEGIKEEVHTEQ